MKIDHLRRLCLAESYDVTETWLSWDILNPELCIPSFDLTLKERNRHGGGIAIYTIRYSRLELLQPELELIIVECQLGTHLQTIAGFYRPPKSSIDTPPKLIEPSNLW